MWENSRHPALGSNEKCSLTTYVAAQGVIGGVGLELLPQSQALRPPGKGNVGQGFKVRRLLPQDGIATRHHPEQGGKLVSEWSFSALMLGRGISARWAWGVERVKGEAIVSRTGGPPHRKIKTGI